MRTLLAALASAAVFVAAPAHAMSQQDRDCPIGKLTSGFDVQLTEALISQDQAQVDPKMQAVADAVTECAKVSGIDGDTAASLFGYTVGRLAVPVFSARLKAAGIPTESIDRALDVGAGRANVQRSELADGDVDKVFAELEKDGIDTDSLDKTHGALIGGYAATVVLYYGFGTALGS